MKTPIFDFVKKYANSDVSRMHMPGHKGKGVLGCERFDITEIDGADVLYSPGGIIAESENNAAMLFDTAHTYYSTQGSTLCIYAMLAIIAMHCEKSKVHILAARNVHKAFVHAAALLDADISWVYPQHSGHICSGDITDKDIEKAIAESCRAIDAVYVTSPDYLGLMLDIESISAVCHKHNIPLIVDNAHGAYLAFCESNNHPVKCGADMCCDSAHKTLPVLTGGAYLHISKNADSAFSDYARRALSLFASTSPSYLILQSLDLCNNYLQSYFKNELKCCIAKIEDLKASIKASGFFICNSEPLKIVFDAKRAGYTGDELALILRTNGIESEFCDDDYLVLMLSPHNEDEDFEKLNDIFLRIKPKAPIEGKAFFNMPHTAAISIRDAVMSKQISVSIESALGRICALPLVSCPPAVPIVISGEIITQNDIELLKRYNISKISIVLKG